MDASASPAPSLAQPSPERPTIIGIFGVPGSGKTFLWNQLLDKLGEEEFKFYEGSQVIAELCPGGLDAFRASSEADKLQWRERAITTIREECTASKTVGVVVGHFMFWNENDASGQIVLAASDWATFTHILYLDVPKELVEQRRRLLDKADMLLHDFKDHSESYNLEEVGEELDLFFRDREHVGTVLVLDGDRTLIAEDTGELLAIAKSDDRLNQLRDIFSGPLGYSHTAFRQAMLLYEEMADEWDFGRLCYNVASQVAIDPEFLSVLEKVASEKHVGAVVITCGLGKLWDLILEKHNLHLSVQVIGGGRLEDGFVVTAAVKATLVGLLKTQYGVRVWAFGDSPLDVPMLREADEAIVVVRDEAIRSKSMDKPLLDAIDNHGLYARQLLLPSDVEPRLDVAKLPVMQLNDAAVRNSIFGRDMRRPVLKVMHESGSNAARMMMTPTRDARLQGPVLRETHRNIGRYLAIRCLSEAVGVEEHPIPHVQGHLVSGFRLRTAQKTSIVALMRGGEPMALGIGDVVSEAMFIHATGPENVKAGHVEGQSTVLLVDSVVNSGASVVRFYNRIRSLNATVRIVVVAGVVQAQCVAKGGLLEGLGRDVLFDMVALRLSDNAFTGQGGTDTGNRLFNTTHLA